MRHMSFSITTSQMENRTKTVTRRLGWKGLKPGDLVQAVEKCMGLKKGEKHVKICVIRILGNSAEPLTTEYVTPEECVKEGFPEKTPEQFIGMFCKHNGCLVGDTVNRIEFEYMD